MPIDWFTVGAQVFNFLLLVALLRIFLYRPVLDAMDRREERITSRLKEAKQQRDQAEVRQRELQDQRKRFEEDKANLLAEAKLDVEMHRKQLVEEARKSADTAKEKWLSQMSDERDSFLQDLRRRVARDTCSLARKTLADLADADLEMQMTRRFLDRLRQESETIRDADVKREIIVRSAFDFSEALRDEVRNTLCGLMGSDCDPQFETDRELLCGMELRIGDRKICWNIGDYLDDFEERLKEVIAEK